MTELQAQAETGSAPAPAQAPAPTPAPVEPEPPLAEAPPLHAAVEEKAVVPPPAPTAAEETKALAVVEKESELCSNFQTFASQELWVAIKISTFT